MIDRTSLIVDVDTGIDDSIALLYLLAREDADIVAVLSTAGNVPTAQVAANNLAWLELCGRTAIEVAVGADGPLSVPLRTTEDTHGPQGIGYAELPAPNCARPGVLQPTPGWSSRASGPVNWSAS